MPNENQIIYHLFLVPIRAVWKYFIILLSITLVLVSFIYTISLDLFLESDILKANPQDIAKIMNFKPQSNTKILDSAGNTISEQFSKYHVYTPYKEIPKKMIDSILAIEDRKFFKHSGIDIYGIFRAIGNYIKPGRKGFRQGASTITQQIVKNLLLTKEKTLTRKLREVILALYIEKNLSKEKIIEIYCNHIFLGHGSYGVAAAAKRYFDKDLSKLDYHETALIAGLFQSPGKYNPNRFPKRAKKRQTEVLLAMKSAGVINKEGYKTFNEMTLPYKEYNSLHGKTAPHFIDYIVEEAKEILEGLDITLKDSGLQIHTTLNPELQSLAAISFEESSDIFKKLDKSLIIDSAITKNKKIQVTVKSEGAMLVLNKRTGEIVSMIGGRDYKESQFNRTVNSLRAPGSVFKSITYAMALKNGHNWNDQHYISPVTIGNYRPRTSNSSLFTETTLLKAFYKSVNSTAVTVGTELGVKKVMRFAKKLGVETPLKDQASTLLGSSEVSMLDMARVYNTFANNGVKIKPNSITKITNAKGEVIYQSPTVKERSKRVLDKRTNELLVEGLKQVVRRGTGYKASHLSSFAAGKTGTSNKSRDNWFCGFTSDLVIIVWMGNDDQNSYRGSISASNTATPLWARFANKSKRLLRTRRLRRPRLTRMAHIHPKFGNRDAEGIPMYFLASRVPKKKISDLIFLEQGQTTRMLFDDF